MIKKTFQLALLAIVVFNAVSAKRSRKYKRPKEEDSTPQPNVVTYSTFGFNDVGSHDGFVPSSPDYASYLSSINQESPTKLYAPAFPSALETTGFNNNYGSQSQDAQSFSTGDDSGPQASMLQYPQNSMNFFNTPSIDSSVGQNKNSAPDELHRHNEGEVNAPIYGTKIESKNKYKHFKQLNSTDFNVFSSGPSATNPSENKYYNLHEGQPTFENKPTSFGEPTKKYQSTYNSYSSPTYPTTDIGDNMKSAPSNTKKSIKYQKVIDFTKMKQNYPTDLDDKFPIATSKPFNVYDSLSNIQNENTYSNDYTDHNNKFPSPTPTFKDSFNINNYIEEASEKETPKTTPYPEFSSSYVTFSNNKNPTKATKFNYDLQDKFKYRPWTSSNYTSDYKNLKNPLQGYQYSTDYSNTTFEFDFSGPKIPMNNQNDEVVPASSNVVDLSTYEFPDTDYSKFKKIPGLKSHFDNDDYTSVIKTLKQQDKYNPEDYVRSLYSTVPTTTSHWGNVFKNSEYTSHKSHPKKPQFVDEISDDVVHIPKRPPYSNKYNLVKYFEGKPSTDWSSLTYNRPHKVKKQNDWNKDVYNTRFKTEEDLLGLRTRDTSHPSYLPSYRPTINSFSSDYDYKKLVEKWRQSYLKAKYNDLSSQDFEGYPSESRPHHVPIPKPYPIEVPHPVIVPVPQPYPVRVPVPKPVAVPVIRELTVPIEKPVPYPVYKKVPYPVDKLVPVPVEKEVQVPVIKPYPVPVPHVRPVFHHSWPRDELDSGINVDDDDDYLPRPETSKRIPYVKRPRSSRNRSRRPSRAHQDRNRRRWPSRRPSGFNPEKYPRRPNLPMEFHSQPSKYSYHDTEIEDFDHENSDYFSYCKRSGKC